MAERHSRAAESPGGRRFVRGLFVTATDTGVGKTAVTGAIARLLARHDIEAGVAKPVQSGALADDPEGDVMLLRAAAAVADRPEDICPYAFAAPLAPLVAGRLEGRVVERDVVLASVRAIAERHDAVLVEGAGGLVVPVGEDWTIADLAVWLDLPVLVVARAGLGTVNHTLLTVEAARRRGLDVAGVVLNGLREETDGSAGTNPELIEAFGDVSVLAVLPWVGENGAALAERLADSLEPGPLLALLKREEALGARSARP
jgi:dethiobiotin synthetase